MAKITLDRGPNSPTPLTLVATPIPNMSVVLSDRPGIVLVSAIFSFFNVALNTATVTCRLLKNGISQGLPDFLHTSTGAGTFQVSINELHPSAAVGDVFTMDVKTSSEAVGHNLVSAGSSMSVQAISADAALCAGIGPASG